MSKSYSEAEIEALLTPEQREEHRRRKARASEFWQTLQGPASPPTSANADEWNLYLAENKDAPGMVAVAIAEAIEEAEARMWSEFVEICEALENEADRLGETPPNDHARGFYAAQRFTAKSIRRSVEHPKYRMRPNRSRNHA